jgi:hypothetical protein
MTQTHTRNTTLPYALRTRVENVKLKFGIDITKEISLQAYHWNTEEGMGGSSVGLRLYKAKNKRDSQTIGDTAIDLGKYYSDGTHTTHKTRNITSIAIRVAEVNEIIRQANELGISVVDDTCTWQAPTKYSPIVYANGIMYIKYKEVDLYMHNRGKGTTWVPKTDKILKHDFGGVGKAQGKFLNDIARMYRKQLHHYKNYGYSL